MKAKQTLLRMILFVLTGIIIGVSLYRWNSNTLTGDRMPMPLGFGVSVILTGSMEPELNVDDLVVIQKTDSIQVGDIIVFQDGSDLVIHRVISMDGDTLVTKGDANNTADQPIALKNVKGELAFSIPGLGAAVNFVKQPLVIAAILAAAFGLTELSYRKEKDKAQDELEDIKAQIRALAEDIRTEAEKE